MQGQFAEAEGKAADKVKEKEGPERRERIASRNRKVELQTIGHEEKDVESKPLTEALTDQIGDLKTIGESGSRLFTHQVCARPSSELLVAKDADQ